MMQNATPTPVVDVSVEVDESKISALAEVVPDRWQNLMFSGNALSVNVLVNPGDRVNQGQVLVSSDETLFNLALLQAESGLLRAQLVLKQLQDLPAPEAVAGAEAAVMAAEANLDQIERSGARQINQDAANAQLDSVKKNLEVLLEGASQSQIDSALADVDAARASLEQARAALAAAKITAPFDGVVIEVYAQNGGSFSPGQPVILLADLATLQVETTDLSEVDAARVSIGDAVVVSFDALPDVSMPGTVIRIADKASPGSAVNFTAVIRLDQLPDGLRWGMTAFVEIR